MTVRLASEKPSNVRVAKSERARLSRARKQRHARGGDKKFSDISYKLRKKHGLCQICLLRPASIALLNVDHIREVGTEGGAIYDPKNLRVLCIPCHKRKPAEREAMRRFG